MPAEKRESDIGSRELASEWRDLIGIIPGAESVFSVLSLNEHLARLMYS